MRFVVILLLLAFGAGPVLAQEPTTNKPAVEETELKPAEYRRTETRRADGYYETEELKKILDPFGPAGMVYIMLIVAIVGLVAHVMAQGRRIDYARAYQRKLDEIAAAQAAGETVETKTETASA